MKILLTGAHGFIGSRLLAALLDAGHELVCPVRAVTARDLGMRGARFVPADFRRMDRSADWAPLLDGMQAAINTVGVFRDSADNGYAAVHGAAPVALFNAARQRGVRVIHFSALGADAGAASEFHRSKRAADDALRALDMPAHIVQPSLVYGPGGASAALFDRLALWPLLPLPGGGRQQIQPVHVQDVVAGVSALLASPPDRVVTIAFCGPQALSLRDYLAALRRGLGVDARQRVIALPGGLARAAAQVGGQEAAGLFGQVEQDRAGFEQRQRRAAVGRGLVDDGGDAVVGRDGEELGLELVAPADVDRVDVVGQAGFFEEQRDLVAVGRGPVIEIDHGGVLFVAPAAAAGRNAHDSGPPPAAP